MMRYPNIDMKRTGARLQSLMKKAGYSVKDIQEYLHLSCPQPIYRWFKGSILPSVDHLFAISRLLGMHMEELLVEGFVTKEKPVEEYIVKGQSEDERFLEEKIAEGRLVKEQFAVGQFLVGQSVAEQENFEESVVFKIEAAAAWHRFNRLLIYCGRLEKMVSW